MAKKEYNIGDLVYIVRPWDAEVAEFKITHFENHRYFATATHPTKSFDETNFSASDKLIYKSKEKAYNRLIPEMVDFMLKPVIAVQKAYHEMHYQEKLLNIHIKEMFPEGGFELPKEIADYMHTYIDYTNPPDVDNFDTVKAELRRAITDAMNKKEEGKV